MGSERIEYKRARQEADQHIIAQIAHLIPDNWLCLSGDLHASPYRIQEGLVEFGTLLTISGKTLEDKDWGYGSTTYEIGQCPQVSSCPTVSGEHHKIKEPFNVALHGKLPCGVRFKVAGALTGETTLTDVKRALYEKLREGYWGCNLEAISSTRALLERPTTMTSSAELLSSNYAPLSMMLHFPIIGGANVDLIWNPELGGSREQLSEIEKGLLKLDFRL